MKFLLRYLAENFSEVPRGTREDEIFYEVPCGTREGENFSEVPRGTREGVMLYLMELTQW